MEKLLKRHFFLVASIFLPLFFGGIYYSAETISRNLTEDPQYDALIVINYNPNWSTQPYIFTVEYGKLKIGFKGENNAENFPNYQRPELYLFDHYTLDVRKIDIDYSNIWNNRVADDDIEALNEDHIRTENTSRDGWRFEYNYLGSRNFLDPFRNMPKNSTFVLRKNTRSIPLKIGGYYDARLIGWIERRPKSKKDNP